MSEWKPIETAPKDGTVIVLGRAESEDQPALSLPGHYIDAMEDGQDYMGNDAGFIDVFYSDFFPGRSFGNPDYMGNGSQPTHWMPLPEPPK